jgi:5-methylcytosine-specific restriction endonuclease McrA
LEHCDIAGVRRTAAQQVRISTEDEYRTAEDRFLVLQPSLDESWWKLFGGLDGISGALVDKVLTEAADQLPTLPDGSKGTTSWRRATALVQLAVSDDPPPASVTIFVDADQATASDGHSGVVLQAGPRVGREALEAILCDAVTELTVTDQNGRLMEYGRRSRTIPPALHRAILHRDANRCAADGCDSRNRLQTHHITPWSQGGATNPDNLITLCWNHHHIIIHQQGFHLYHHPKHGRIRFRRPEPRPPPT